jgi:exodeoxyribonuclease V alpha subunit
MSIKIEDIKALKNREAFQDIDLQFAAFIHALADAGGAELFLAAALASYAVRGSHVCVRLDSFAGRIFPEYSADRFGFDDYERITLRCPDIDAWLAVLRDSDCAGVISAPEDYRRTPLILDEHNRLYLNRYWSYENELAQQIFARCTTAFEPPEMPPGSICSISRLFQHANPADIDWQQVAVFAAMRNPFSVITGGPGTGKTTVAAAIIALTLQLKPDSRISLCAPTGKAQARLREAVLGELDNLNCSVDIKKMIAQLRAFTIHSLLKPLHNSPEFRHNAENPLGMDLIIVDEASMVSLPVMIRLFRAIPPQTRIILLGDKDQLASVESGAVLADICQAAQPGRFSPDFAKGFAVTSQGLMPELPLCVRQTFLTDSAVELKVSHRFNDNEGIGLLRNAVNRVETDADARQAWEVAQSNAAFGLKTCPLPEAAILEKALTTVLDTNNIPMEDGVMHSFRSYLSLLRDYESFEALDKAYAIIGDFKILCAQRNGVYGVENINALVSGLLGLDKIYSPGMPLMITRNDYTANLFNGDVGLVWNTVNADGNPEPRVFFPNPAYAIGEPLDKKYISFSPVQLPEHEPVFAMTIHKSQGSGFRNILMIMPASDSAVLTRELIYTGITRARKQVELWTHKDIFLKAVKRKTMRDSGLEEKLSR